ncbi:MAG: VWA domain-containing protein [Bdellovibrionaceae bacterium]|nr:VWA domain-containing protein [Pseudobdellovibrionaceae bacterium]
MFRFENTAVLMWLWLIPFLWFVGWMTARRRAKKLAKGIGTRLAPFLTRSISPRKRAWKTVLQLAALFFFILALARPQMGESKQEVKSEGIELIFAIDVSDSMMAEDVKPNRLEQAKVELSRLVDQLPGHKVGILAFAGRAALLSPLTNDPAAIKMYLESLTTSSVSTQGTCFECALKTAADAFKRGGTETDDTTRVARAILIASDGEDHEPGAIEAAQALVKEGIRIDTIAYGTEKGGAIPVRDGMGYLRGYKKDRSGQVILSQVKGEALRQIASAGKGSFTFASFGGDHLKRIAADLNRLEKAQFESTMATQYDERFQIFLLIGLILAFMDLLLGERRLGFRLWKGRFEVPPT